MDSNTDPYSEPPCPLQQLRTPAPISPSTLDPTEPGSCHREPISSTHKTTHSPYEVWGCDSNSTNGLVSPTTRPSEPDLFNGLSTLIPGLRRLDYGARAATNAERKITFLDGCRLYPKAMAWSAVVSSTLIMEGFDTLLLFTFFSLPAFKRYYGVPSKNGDYEIPARWQFGLSTAIEVGEIAGLLLNGLLADRVGYRITISAAIVLLFFCILLPFFAVNLQMLLAGQILCGIPWGVFQTLTINYAAEVMPVALRAYLLSSINMCWVVGQLLATGVTRSLANNESTLSFRLPFGLQWAIGLPVLIGVILAPESPWWLIRHDQTVSETADAERRQRGSDGRHVDTYQRSRKASDGRRRHLVPGLLQTGRPSPDRDYVLRLDLSAIVWNQPHGLGGILLQAGWIRHQPRFRSHSRDLWPGNCRGGNLLVPDAPCGSAPTLSFWPSCPIPHSTYCRVYQRSFKHTMALVGSWLFSYFHDLRIQHHRRANLLRAGRRDSFHPAPCKDRRSGPRGLQLFRRANQLDDAKYAESRRVGLEGQVLFLFRRDDPFVPTLVLLEATGNLRLELPRDRHSVREKSEKEQIPRASG